MKKLRVCVIMGGPSSEHEVSLMSGKNVLENIDHSKYEVSSLTIEKSGEWPVTPESLIGKIDLAYLALHGEYGEDGHLQMLLENLGIPYTGTDSKGSALGMNKSAAARLFKARGLNVPEGVDVSYHDRWSDFVSPFGYPIVVKPMDRGSSVGVSIVRSERELKEAFCLAFDVSKHVRVERFVSGRELTCGVIENGGKDTALPPTEIISGANFFDYNAKYTAGASKEITPANLPADVTKKVQEAALIAHNSVNGKGVTRTDFILTTDNTPYVLEINTLPGMTKTSLVPQAAAVMGISMPLLIDKIIADAVRRFDIR